MCFTLFSSSKFALFDQVRHLRRSAAYWLLVERLDEMGARFKLSWEHDPRTHGTPIVVSWSQSSDPGRSTWKDKPYAFDHLSIMKDEILNLNLNEQGSVVDCPSAFEEVSGQVKAAALSLLKVFKVFPRRWSLSKPGGKPSWRSQPWPRTDAFGDKIKSYRKMSMRFFQKLTDQWLDLTFAPRQ